MSKFRHDPIPSSEITDESIYRQRRQIITTLGLSPALLLPAACAKEPPAAPAAKIGSSHSGFKTSEELTTLEDITSYNNFYEFGTNKNDPIKHAHTLQTQPWSIKVSGACEKPGTYALEEILKGKTQEERIYRMRCVEGWSMVIPWLGIPLAAILKQFQPTSDAKYVAFTSLADRKQMPGLRYNSINWPYREGLRMDEAMHPLTLIATGIYGKPLPKQNGAPLRLVVPWKYGFKGLKSIVDIKFVKSMPDTAWNDLQPSEYGFFSNVNPNVDHPRWSQKTERRIAGRGGKLFTQRMPTKMFNGYADQVASLYSNLDLKKWY